MKRFIIAHKKHYRRAILELRKGCKQTHWMWYVLPQHRQLGRSFRSRYYGLSGIAQARNYLATPLLEQRYIECLRVLANLCNLRMGELDFLKLQSSLTLFHLATDSGSEVHRLTRVVLDKYFDGKFCNPTYNLAKSS